MRNIFRYALLSSPEHSCNPTADRVNGAQDGGVIVIGAITLTVLLYCVANGTTILNIFNPEVTSIFRIILLTASRLERVA